MAPPVTRVLLLLLFSFVSLLFFLLLPCFPSCCSPPVILVFPLVFACVPGAFTSRLVSGAPVFRSGPARWGSAPEKEIHLRAFRKRYRKRYLQKGSL